MLVRHFMTEKVHSLRPEQTVLEAFQKLKRLSIRRAPVLERGRLAGIVSERDLVSILPGTAAQAMTSAGGESMDIPVREVMTTPVLTIGPDASLACAASLMLERKIGGIPVEEDGKVRGIITESDIFRALWRILSAEGGRQVLVQGWPDPENDSADYLELCQRNGCLLRNLIHFSGNADPGFTFLSVEGGDAEALIEDLRQRSERVIALSVPDRAGAPAS